MTTHKVPSFWSRQDKFWGELSLSLHAGFIRTGTSDWIFESDQEII
jgi:hypothetical protein